MTSYAELHWKAGRVASRPYLICLDCGEHWFDIAGKLDILKQDHTGPLACPADRRSSERFEAQRRAQGFHGEMSGQEFMDRAIGAL